MSHVDLKVVLLGMEYGGKTSLVERYLYDRFDDPSPYQNTIGAAYGERRIGVRNRKIRLGIWDTAGSERYEAMSRIYYRGAGAAVVCFDLTDRQSYQKAKFWVEELRKHEEKCKIFLCGTKKDLIMDNARDRAIHFTDTVDYAEEIGAKLVETSSKTGEGIAVLFRQIAEDYLDSIENKQDRLRLEESCSRSRTCC